MCFVPVLSSTATAGGVVWWTVGQWLCLVAVEFNGLLAAVA